MIFDAHIHVGQFFDIYTSPNRLVSFLEGVRVEKFAVSSTTICEGNYQKVLDELEQLHELAKDRMFPVLWLLPQMFEDGGLEMFLSSGFNWKCLKIHPQLNPTMWKPRGKNMCRLMQLAQTLDLPVLIHTGDFDYCHAGLYLQLAKKNPDIKIILAHGRPIDETINVMKACDNVYTDTAFMPTGNIVTICNAGLTDRVLWGTDYPIPKYYYRRKNMRKHYDSLISSLEDAVSESEFAKITNNNFNIIFKN